MTPRRTLEVAGAVMARLGGHIACAQPDNPNARAVLHWRGCRSGFPVRLASAACVAAMEDALVALQDSQGLHHEVPRLAAEAIARAKGGTDAKA